MPSHIVKVLERHPFAVYRLPALILVILLAVRLILSLRVFDRFYAESAIWPERSFTGLLVHMGFLLAQIGLLTFMVLGMESEETGDPVILFLIGLLVISGIGYLWCAVSAGRADRQSLLFALPAGINDLIFAALVFLALYILTFLGHKPTKGLISAGAASAGAFIGIINVYVNYLIAARAPNDPSEAPLHAARAWVAIGVGIVVAAIVIASTALLLGGGTRHLMGIPSLS